ncbi:MAG: flavin reductase family protein [Kofleriaceae bacterium]|nr:flavin reductase family protein [Kofleriaceae bacterium]
MVRIAVPLRYAYRLLNHGPATLVTSRWNGRSNVMAAQWVMPTDYDPPKLAVVIDRSTFTHTLVEPSGVLGINIPGRDQAALTWRVGSHSGADGDKLADVETFQASLIDVPLVEGCIGWLEARVLHSPALDEVAARYELLVVEVLAAWVDERCWREHHLILDERQTLHHLGGGTFRVSGDLVIARRG